MTENSPGSMPRSSDTMNVLPSLNENKGTLSLSIDKSVSKVASWFVALIIANSIFLGIAIVLVIWMLNAYHNMEREYRMQQYYILELDAKFIASGIKKPDEAISKKLLEQQQSK